MNRRQVVVSGAVSALASRPALSLAGVDGLAPFRTGEVRTERHRTAYLECGPVSGPPMIFLHGFPELAIVWKAQMTYFAAKGWRCVAPDMRGYGGSSAPTHVADYTVGEISTDMVELHQALGARPAVWVGHDWGAPIAWAMASNHPERCRGVVGLSVPTFLEVMRCRTWCRWSIGGCTLSIYTPLASGIIGSITARASADPPGLRTERRGYDQRALPTRQARGCGETIADGKPAPGGRLVRADSRSAGASPRLAHPVAGRFRHVLSRCSSGRASFPRLPGISTTRRTWSSPPRPRTLGGSICPSCSSRPPTIP